MVDAQAITTDLQSAIAWLALGQQVIAGGEAVWADVKAALANHGIAADTATLDAIIVDAARRKAQADADLASQS